MLKDIIEADEINEKIYDYVQNFKEREVSELPLGGLYKIVEVALEQTAQIVAREVVRKVREGFKKKRVITKGEFDNLPFLEKPTVGLDIGFNQALDDVEKHLHSLEEELSEVLSK